MRALVLLLRLSWAPLHFCLCISGTGSQIVDVPHALLYNAYICITVHRHLYLRRWRRVVVWMKNSSVMKLIYIGLILSISLGFNKLICTTILPLNVFFSNI